MHFPKLVELLRLPTSTSTARHFPARGKVEDTTALASDEAFVAAVGPHDLWAVNVSYQQTYVITKENLVNGSIDATGKWRSTGLHEEHYQVPVTLTERCVHAVHTEFVGWRGDQVMLKNKRGHTARFRPTDLGVADQKWLYRWKKVRDKHVWNVKSGLPLKATLVAYSAEKIKLKKTDGTTQEVDISDLSGEDRKFTASLRNA
jgi:hypothetical protein